jgi:glycerophosphoryl diester phosphodiesterase
MTTSIKVLLIACLYVYGSVVLHSCKISGKMTTSKTKAEFLKIGHRGTRGLMPENTIPAMIKGIEVGANTMEFDVHISKDGKVIVYHDESFNPDYTTKPDGSEIAKNERQKYTFYQMNYSEIRAFIIGKKDYPAYPHQQKIVTYTPLLSELIDSVEAFTKSRNLPPVNYLLEVKSNEKTDGIEQPAPEEYMKILMADVTPKNLGSRLIIQSFDMRPLKVLHLDYPGIALGFLTGDKQATFEQNIKDLGFKPAFYNAEVSLSNAELINKCHASGIRITPWTVNTVAEMKRQKELKVDGIITDYPNYFKELE